MTNLPPSMVTENGNLMPMSSWTNELVLQLLKEFEMHEMLWDPKHSLYFNMAAKEKAWEEIGEVLGKQHQECKRKVESLKGSYRRERSKYNRSRLYSSTEAPYTPKWFAFEHMKFLDERVDRGSESSKRSRKDQQFSLQIYDDPDEVQILEDAPDFRNDWGTPFFNQAEPEEERLEEDSDLNMEVYCEPFRVVNVDEDIPDPDLNPEMEPEPEPEEPTLKCHFIAVETAPVTEESPDEPQSKHDFAEVNGVPLQIQDVHSLFQAAALAQSESPTPEDRPPSCSCKDECTVYGQYVANKLRRLDARSRALVQNKINTLLFKAEMKLFNSDENLS